MNFTRLLFLAAALAATALWAQPTDQKPTGGRPHVGTMTRPMAEMQKFAFALGKWQVEEKMEPSEYAPKGGTGTGTAEFHFVAGGRALVQNYHSKNPMGGIQGHAVTWYDAKASFYRTLWCDNVSPAPCDDSGSSHWEGDSLLLSMQANVNGKQTNMTATLANIKPDSFTYSEQLDGKPVMTIQYTRIAGHHEATKPNPKM